MNNNIITATIANDWQNNPLTREYAEVVTFIERTAATIIEKTETKIVAQYAKQYQLINAADLLEASKCRSNVTIKF